MLRLSRLRLTCASEKSMFTRKDTDAAGSGTFLSRRGMAGGPDASQILVRGVGRGLCGVLAFLTLIVQDWIEVVFRVDPDAHSGTAEWLIVLLLGAGVVVSTLMAGYEWRRTSTAAGEA